MSTPEAVVAAALRKHRQREIPSIWDECYCGWRPSGAKIPDHAEHVAAVVIEQLGLTDEWSFVTESDVEDGSLFPDESEITDDRRWAEERVAERCQSCDHCRNAQPKRLIRRSVTPWTEL